MFGTTKTSVLADEHNGNRKKEALSIWFKKNSALAVKCITVYLLSVFCIDVYGNRNALQKSEFGNI